MAAEWIIPAVAGAVEAGTGLFGALAGMRNTDQTNAINSYYANLQYQYNQERDKIEDQRYDEETAYNRAFAEDERNYQRQWAEENRDYERALQQQIFEREDTAISRQANELSKLGINPLSSNMNGSNAGSVVSSGSAPSSVSEPSMSSRASKSNPVLNYTHQMYDYGQLVNAVSSVAQGIQGVLTGSYQRDSLQLQNDAQFLANYEKANDLGLEYTLPNRLKKTKRSPNLFESQINGDNPFRDSFGWKSYGNWRQKNSNIHAINSYLYDTDDDKTKFIKNLANGDFIGVANNLINNLKYTIDHLGDLKNNITDLFNPFSKR